MATRAQVARLAQVSESTVSYVLNGQRPITEETKARVHAAIKELNYVPHYAAGLLAGRKSRTVAMLMPGKDGVLTPSSIEYLNGASIAANAAGYHVLIWSSDQIEISELVDSYNSGFIAGLILMEIRMKDARVDFLKQSKIPFVMIGRCQDLAGLQYIDRDFEGAGEVVIEHLATLGHSEISVVSNKRVQENQSLGADVRFDSAIKKEAKARKLNIKEYFYYNEPRTGEIALREILTKNPKTTAIISLNEQTSIGLVNSATRLGIKIPQELSVISTNTPEVQVELTVPEITTISPPSQLMGQEAMNNLVELIKFTAAEKSKKPIKKEMPEFQRLWRGELVIRQTTAKPRKAVEIKIP
jgi:DNA-binding LacI/PurR family transcriptional regulator